MMLAMMGLSVDAQSVVAMAAVAAGR